MKLVYVVLVVIIASVAIFFASRQVAQADGTRERVDQCTVAAAIAQHYPDPYSKEAWDLFSPGCIK